MPYKGLPPTGTYEICVWWGNLWNSPIPPTAEDVIQAWVLVRLDKEVLLVNKCES